MGSLRMTTAVGIVAVCLIVMVAVNIRVIAQGAVQQARNCLVRVSAASAVKPDAGRGQRCLCTAADAAADQGVHAVLHEKTGQCAVSAAVGVYNFAAGDFATGNVIKFKLFGMAKMLKNLAIFISNCNFHR